MSIAAYFRGFWQERTQRERAVLLVGMVGLVAIGTFELAWRPMLRDLARLDEQLPRLRAQVEQMRRAADELPGLKQRATIQVLDPRQLRAVVQRTALDRGLTVSALNEAGGRIDVRIESASFASWTNWVDDLHRRHGIVVVSAQIVALTAPGTVRIETRLGPIGIVLK